MTQPAGSDPFHIPTMSPDCIPSPKPDDSNSRRSEPGVSPVRITYIIDHLHNIGGGGEQALLRIIQHLPRDRFQPSVITFNVKPRSVQLLREMECPLHIFPIRRTYGWDGLKAASKIRRLLAAERPRIVHSFFETSNIFGGLITKLSLGPKLLSSRRDMGVLQSTKHRLAYRLINRLTDRVLAVSKEVSRFCIEREGIRSDKVAIVYNGVDLERVDAAEADVSLRKKLGLDKASHLVITVANIRRVKGLDVFIKAAAIVRSRFPSAVFAIAGWPNEPQYFAELKQLVADLCLHDNVRFLGEVEDVFPLLKQSDVFCLLSRTEGFSNALLEAMACRLPCVATRVGGNAEAIDDERDGFLVNAEDPKAAADRIALLLESPERAREIGGAARRTIEVKFTVNRMIDQLTELYSSLLGVSTDIKVEPMRLTRNYNRQTFVTMMARRGRSTIRCLLGRDVAGRNLEVFPDDSFIVSYPRSGNTWLRFLVGNLICREGPINFHNLERVIPDIHVNSTRYISGISRPRLLKSHEYFDPRYRRVVYIVRDPRDVAVSYYRYYRKLRVLPDGYPMDRYIALFLTGELQTWGSWGENVASWLAARWGSGQFLMLRYEDLLADTVDQLSMVADFLEIQSTRQDLVRTVELCSVERMRILEKAEGDDWVTIKGGRKDVPFIGRATSGQWKTELTSNSVSMIESAWGKWIATLEYDLTCPQMEEAKQRAVVSPFEVLDAIRMRRISADYGRSRCKK